MSKFYTLCLLLILGFGSLADAQIFNSADPVITYNSNNPPAAPAWGTIGKWVRTLRNEVNFANKDSYKCYYLNGMPFRLKFPKTYQPGVNDGKNYPILIFFHGRGEGGGMYDNEYSLYHGGGKFCANVDNGNFDGFILVPQSTTGFFGTPHFAAIKQILDTLIQSNKLDENRIFVNGLSAGGTETWEFMFNYPKMVAGFLPISGCSISYRDRISTFKYIPMWIFQGGQDNNPHPNTTAQVVDAAIAAGANAKETLYPDGGHGIWNNAWDEPDFWPFLRRQHKANPWPLNGHYEFCPGEAVNATLGLTAGFDGYEWRKDGVVIPNATTNELAVTSYGTYDARIKRGNTWSPWSPTPVVVKLKAATQTPPISISGLMSKVIPATDGKNYVTLSLPAGYTSYLWQKVGDTTTLGTERTLNATTAGQYQAKVTEQFGCSSAFSVPFTVIPANGFNAPSPASGVTATAISKTGITLDWTDNPNATYNETGYEIYRSLTTGGPYQLVNITSADATTWTDNTLNPNTKYFYVIRAVNNTSAAAVSNEASTQTQVDANPPTAPADLKVTATSANSVSLAWQPSTDDVGVYKYDVYINGLKSYTVDNSVTEFTAYGLKKDSLYTFVVKARDIAGNSSPRSNQVSSSALINGLKYRYYEGSWSALPDFNTLTPIATGYSPVPDLGVRLVEDRFGIVWEGFIRIPVTGNYTFITNSDDGSKLWIDTDYVASATPVVNNDGGHGPQDREGTVYLTAGMHKIAIAYFEINGGQSLSVSWKNTASGITTAQQITADFYKDLPSTGNLVPKTPGNILATALSYNKINVTWVDSSNNETNFEVYRATSLAGPFTTIATIPANQTSYIDSNLVAQTTYFYRVKAINKNGDSGFNIAEAGGFQYDVYAGTFSTMPNFANLTPVKSGSSGNITLDVRDRETNYAIKFAGYINVPTTGSYTFYTASDDGSKLYVNGFAENKLVVNNNYLQGTTERQGSITLTKGIRYAFYVTYFQQGGSQTLSVSYAGPGLTKRLMPDSIFAYPKASAKTLAMPPTPTAPSALTLTALSSSRIGLAWNDNSANETGFEVFRSANDSSNFKLYTTINANSTAQATFTDSSLFANVTYYYKIRAKNEGGYSVFTKGAGISTLNNVPVLNQVANRSVRYGTQLVLNFTATDPDGETLTLTAANVPSFGAFGVTGNGTASLTLNPTVANQGTYPNITVTAADQHGGVATTSFTLTVNDNYAPVIAPVSNVSLNENTTAVINVSATDQNTQTVTWTATSLPSFATFTPSGNSGTISLAPGYIDAGVYNVTLQADDNNGGIDTKTFTITVVDVDPNRTVYINFSDGSYPPGTPWNSTNKQPVINDLFPNLKDQSGAATSIGMKIVSNWSAIGNGSNYYGASTGNNSGVVPDNVMKTAYWSNTSKQTFKLYGLSSTSKYSFTFFGSRGDVTDNRMTNYTIGGTTVSLQTSSNKTNTVAINNVVPDANGEITVDMQNGTGSVFSYINALIVKVSYDDGKAPARPTTIAAQSTATGVGLTWKDVAFNETAYEVYRANTAAGPYALLNPVAPANAVAYADTSAKANKQYYYTIRAINANGASAYSDTVAILTGNNSPKLDSIAPVSMKNNDTVTINLRATDDAGDILSFATTNLPSFAKLTDNGDGTGSIRIIPAAGNIGKYTFTVTSNDNNGGSTTRTVTVAIRDKNLTAVYIHFNQTLPGDAPWNNFNSYPGNTAAISNLQNEVGVATPFKIQLLDAFTGTNTGGATTGNNSGVYPDNVIAGNYYTGESTARRIRISGLSAAYKYNLVFFGSRTGNDNKNTIYTVGANSVTLNAANNSTNTVQINGVASDSNGVIDFTVKQAAGATYGYINALVLQYYVDNGTPLNPTTATAQATSKTGIQLKWMDNSNNETGFEVWRSTDNNNFSLLTTLPVNANAFNDNGLATDTRYYYKVRALKDTARSEFTNVASASTFLSAVYINCNVFNPAGAPWNNTNSAPAEGLQFPNLKDDNGNNTGLTMVIEKAFTGDNPYGVNTGNNSGIYPDNVISSTYWVDINVEGKLRIKGLNLAKRYNFVFFASRDGSGDRTSNYTVGTTTVSLNAAYNTSNTVQINDIVPDANGEALITVTAGGASIYGYIGALVIQSYSPEASQLDPTLIMTKNSQGAFLHGQNTSVSNVSLTRVYPNPFDSQLTLDLTNTGKTSGNLTVSVLDMSGKILYSRLIAGVDGAQRVTLDLGGAQIPQGPCFLKVMDGDKLIKTVKLIKNW